MKKLLVVSIVLVFTTISLATQQVNDIVFYKGRQSELETHWAYASPLQIYYLTNKDEKYPFKASNTANWRGHIATWEIKNGAFSLLSVWREYYTSEKGRVRREEGQVPLEKLFGGKVKDGKVKADWFTGYLLVLSKPYKEWFDSPYSDSKFYVIQHKTTVIVEVKEGKIVSEHAYQGKEFFKNYTRYLKKEGMNEKDKAIFGKYFGYINSFRQRSEKEEKPKKVYTEKDFSLFLKRFNKNEKDKVVSIPLTDFCLIRNATYKDNQRGFLINSDIIPSENMNLLKFEMGASDVPEGPWSPYRSGAVLFVMKIGKLMPCTIDLGTITDANTICKNNYARYESPQSVSGTVKIESVNQSRIIMSGNIIFKSRSPSTLQEIQLSNSMIPIYTIPEYMDLHKKDDAAYVMLRQKKYEELRNARHTQTNKELIRKRVKKHLTKSNVDLRVVVDEVFFLADIYADEGNDDEAIRLYEKGLQVDSWRLDYQLKLARLLKKRGDKVKAAEKGKIIFQNAEEEALICDTEKLLSELGVTSFSENQPEKPEYVKHIEIVLVPMGKIDMKLLSELKAELQSKMGIKYSISKKELGIGKPTRDYTERYLDQLLDGIESKLPKKDFQQLLSETGLKKADFATHREKVNFIEHFFKKIQLPQAQIEHFHDTLKEMEGKGQYHALGLLLYLRKNFKVRKETPVKGYIGITEGDIFAKDYNFLFGWGRLKHAVVSYHRFTGVFNDEPPNRPRLLKRSLKQAISSSFIALGIPRCTTPACARAYPNDLIEHDRKKTEICHECREQLNSLISRSK